VQVPVLIQPPAHHPAVEDQPRAAPVKVDIGGTARVTRPAFHAGQRVPHPRHHAHVERINEGVSGTLPRRRSRRRRFPPVFADEKAQRRSGGSGGAAGPPVMVTGRILRRLKVGVDMAGQGQLKIKDWMTMSVYEGTGRMISKRALSCMQRTGWVGGGEGSKTG
jgi:hypothetical protein